jgi:hypothetical protein
MTEPLTSNPPDELALKIYERIQPSLVDVRVTRAEDGTEFHTLGVVTESAMVTAWSGVLGAAGAWEKLEKVSIRQGTRSWWAAPHSLRAAWVLCALHVDGDFPVPTLPSRRSNTLVMGERLMYAVAGADHARPRLGWTQLVDVFRSADTGYDRAHIWTARLDPEMPREHAFAFDAEGRVAGLLEPLPPIPSMAALMPGERVGDLGQRCWIEMQMKLGSFQQIVDEHQGKLDSLVAESLCVVGLAFQALGDNEGSRQAWTRAAAKDPLNPWPHRALGDLLAMEGRAEEAAPFLARAAQLEAQEPAAPRD